ncbi:MAG: ABC transporter permease subunit [Oscillospiraceae bacterium]|nr:ABC transporter permease subunit [Oscillospiraceae bacterium]MBR2366033.1 ABC transporter permease subunit [Oscillospiraceae bacterium]MBR3849505.1 ABC transporter permease subunit [Oscillospiraceae bacterium]
MRSTAMWAEKRGAKLLAVLLALLLWQLAAMLVDLPVLLVSPLQVLRRLLTIWREPDFFLTVWHSLLRIALGFAAALVLGTFLAILAGRFPVLRTLLWPYVTVMKTVPVASFIIISLIWLNAENLAVFISFLMVFPTIYLNVLQGYESADRELLEMARVFRVPYARQLRHIYLPAVRPFLLSACSVALGMAWKSGVAAEVIAISKHSLGEKLYESKVYFLNVDLFSWTVVIVLSSFLFEKLALAILRLVLARGEGRVK